MYFTCKCWNGLQSWKEAPTLWNEQTNTLTINQDNDAHNNKRSQQTKNQTLERHHKNPNPTQMVKKEKETTFKQGKL